MPSRPSFYYYERSSPLLLLAPTFSHRCSNAEVNLASLHPSFVHCSSVLLANIQAGIIECHQNEEVVTASATVQPYSIPSHPIPCHCFTDRVYLGRLPQDNIPAPAGGVLYSRRRRRHRGERGGRVACCQQWAHDWRVVMQGAEILQQWAHDSERLSGC